MYSVLSQSKAIAEYWIYHGCIAGQIKTSILMLMCEFRCSPPPCRSCALPILTRGMVRTKLLRNYLLSGGTNGRMIRGEDIVELEFLKGVVRGETFHLIFSKKEALANIGEIDASRNYM